jgi:hypothetical protein
MRRAPFRPQAALVLVLLAFAARPASAGAPSPLIATQISVGNANLLFTGTDADGGIGDWYLSNGVVQLVVDDVGPQADLVGVVPPPVPAKQSEAGFSGGSIIDLGRNGANDDQLAQMFTVGGLDTDNFIVYETIGASGTPTEAKITLTGRLLGFDVPAEELAVVTEYTLFPGDSFVTMTTRVTNESATTTAAGFGGFLDVFVWTDKSCMPFSPLADHGFDHPVLDLNNLPAAIEFPRFMAAIGSNGPADGVIDPVSGAVAGEVSYGLLGVQLTEDADGSGGPTLPVVSPIDNLLGISSHQLTAFGNSPGNAVPPGGTIEYVRRVYVGDANSVASVANPMLEALAPRVGYTTGTISGNVDAADEADVATSVIATATSAASWPNGPITHFRTSDAGAFSGVVLPAGTYDLEFRSVERPPVVVTGVVVADGADTAVTVPPLAALGTVVIELAEKRPGPDVPIPGKVVFKGRKGDPDPEFAKDIFAFDVDGADRSPVRNETFGGSFSQGNTAYFTGGTTTLRVRPGRYEVYASRGLEYGVQRKTVTVKSGKTKTLKFAIDKLLETPDAVSADFHIHSARSLDSSAGLPARVAAYAGEGVEMMVSTDHDYHLDYGPVIDSLDLDAFVNSIPGVEITGSVPNPPPSPFPNSTGHINAWPMPIEADQPRDGSIDEEFVAPNWIFSRLRGKGAEVIQYNHVRAGVSGLTSIGFFNNIGYRRDLPITAVENEILLSTDITGASGVANPDGTRNIDFDVFEVGNGTNAAGWIATRADWFSLLAQVNTPLPGGVMPFHPGTGVADSHRVTVESAGYFRTFVLGTGDDPAAVDKPAFDQSILAGHMTATTGPYIEVTLSDGAGNSAGMGEVFVPADPNLTLHVRVQASNWVPVDEVRVLVNGAVPAGLAFDSTTKPKLKKTPKQRTSKSKKSVLRFDEEIPIQLSGTDAFVIVEAGAKLDPFPVDDEFASLLVPGYVAMAFTNPIFVDFGNDGFDPPGLPPAALAAAVAPLESARGRAAVQAKAAHDTKDHPSLHGIRIPQEAADRARAGAR